MDGLLGVAGMIIDSDEMDHSRKFPAFSTSKFMIYPHLASIIYYGNVYPHVDFINVIGW
jgi:hypothetical protein